MQTEITDRRLIRRALLGLGGIALALPWILSASNRVFDEIHNVPYQWVSADFGPRRQFDDFLRRFDRPEVIILSYEGCSVDDPRLARLSARLSSDLMSSSGYRYRTLFPDVSTGYEALRSLMAPPLELPRAAALRRLRGILAGPDGQTSCAVIAVSRTGADLGGQIGEIIRQAASDTVGLPPGAFIMAGGLLEGAEIDAESLRSSRLVLPSAIVSLILCVICLRSIWLSVPIFLLAMLGQGWVLMITATSGIAMNAILMVLAPLVFTLTMSAGVHLANYYREERARAGQRGAMARAVRIGWLPCWLATFTTAIGLASLAVSEVVPVRQFGLLGAAGCVIAFAFLILVFPGAVIYWTGPRSTKRSNRPTVQRRSGALGSLRQLRRSESGKPKSPAAMAAGQSPAEHLESPRLAAIGALVTRHGYLLSFLMLALMGIGAAGITRLRTSVDVLSLLPQNSRVVDDYRWLQQRLGPLIPLEFIVEFDRDDTSLMVERLQVLQRIQARLLSQDEVGGAISALNFLPSVPRSGGVRATVERRVFNKLVEQNFQSIVDAGYVAQDAQGQAWRLSVRTHSIDPRRAGDVLESLQQHAQAAVVESVSDGQIATVQLTGIVPLVHASQSLLLRDLTISFLTAFFIVGCVMITATRSLRSGLVAMIPNLFPVVIVFGFLGWIGSPVDIGTMMTASVALGIAVDGTLHFLVTFHREKVNFGGQIEPAVLVTLQRCGRALGHATLICGLGLLVFCLSGFLPTQRFAIMIFALLSAAFVGDVVLFPALLTGPFKHLYRQKKNLAG